MKKYLRQFVIVLLIIPCVVVLLAACGSNGNKFIYTYTKAFIDANLTGDFWVKYERTQGSSITILITARKDENWYQTQGGSEYLYLKEGNAYKVYEKKFSFELMGFDWIYMPQYDSIITDLITHPTEGIDTIYSAANMAVRYGAEIFKKVAETTVLGRECIVFGPRDGDSDTRVTVDKETGITMKITEAQSTSGGYGVVSVICTEFLRGDAVSIPTIDL